MPTVRSVSFRAGPIASALAPLACPALPRALVTDSHDPTILKLFTEIIPYRPEFGSGVRQKIYLDQYSPYAETLFIDSDCLVLSNLDSFWTSFAGQSLRRNRIQVLGEGISGSLPRCGPYSRDFQCNENSEVQRWRILFYAHSSDGRFFRTARDVLDNSSSLRLSDFRRDGPNDEAVYAVAMAIHRLEPTSMGVGGMWTPVGYKRTVASRCAAGKMLVPEGGNDAIS